MKRLILVAAAVTFAVGASSVSVAGQAKPPASIAKPAAKWVMPRTPDGKLVPSAAITGCSCMNWVRSLLLLTSMSRPSALLIVPTPTPSSSAKSHRIIWFDLYICIANVLSSPPLLIRG